MTNHHHHSRQHFTCSGATFLPEQQSHSSCTTDEGSGETKDETKVKSDKMAEEGDSYLAEGDFKQHNTVSHSHLDHNPPHSHDLPNEIVSLIINHLAKRRPTLCEATLVNKQFHAIANPFIWRVLNFDDGHEYYRSRSDRFLACLSMTSTQRLAILGPHIYELCLHDHYWTDEPLTQLLPHLPFLERMTINHSSKINDTSFRLSCTLLTHVAFLAIGHHCHRLQSLEWYIWINQAPEWLDLLTPCPLRHLRLVCVHSALDTTLIAIIQKFHRLTCLDLTHGSFDHVNLLLTAPPTPTLENRNSTATTTTTACWPQLKTLHLKPCGDLDDTTLGSFIHTHSQLEQLDLIQAKLLTDTTLDAMMAWLPQLTRVTITDNDHITPEGVRRLVCGCYQLENITIYGCRHILTTHFFSESLQPSNIQLQNVVLDALVISNIRQERKSTTTTAKTTTASILSAY